MWSAWSWATWIYSRMFWARRSTNLDSPAVSSLALYEGARPAIQSCWSRWDADLVSPRMVRSLTLTRRMEACMGRGMVIIEEATVSMMRRVCWGWCVMSCGEYLMKLWLLIHMPRTGGERFDRWCRHRGGSWVGWVVRCRHRSTTTMPWWVGRRWRDRWAVWLRVEILVVLCHQTP